MRRITTQHLRTVLSEGRLATLADLADLLVMSRQGVQQRIGAGDLPPSIGTVGGTMVWDKDEVLDYRSKWGGK